MKRTDAPIGHVFRLGHQSESGALCFGRKCVKVLNLKNQSRLILRSHFDWEFRGSDRLGHIGAGE
jgi:hypothetical protein